MATKVITLQKPYLEQAEIENDPHRFRVLACGRRWGKTVCAMREAFQMLLRLHSKEGGRHRGWVVAPTFPLVREDWLVAEVLLKDAIIDKKLTEMKLDFGALGFIEFKSAEREDEGLRGAGLDFCVVDEASRVSRKSWEQGLRPALADKRGRCIFISTPKGRNWFYELWMKGKEDNSEIKSWQYPTFSNPFFPKDEWEILKETTPDLILRQEYLADFLEDSASVFKNIESCYRGNLEDNIEGEKYAIGIDLGKAEDFTVISVIRESNVQLVNLQRINKIDWSLQKKHIQAISRIYRNHIIYMDTTGIGDPIEDDLTKAGLVVRGYKFTNPSKQALIEQLIVAIEQGLIGIPNIPKTQFLIDELKAFTYEMPETSGGKIFYHAPEGLHDDGVISLGLAIRGISYALYNKKQEQSEKLPINSPAYIERKAYEQEILKNSRLPRRFREKIPEPVFS